MMATQVAFQQEVYRARRSTIRSLFLQGMNKTCSLPPSGGQIECGALSLCNSVGGGSSIQSVVGILSGEDEIALIAGAVRRNVYFQSMGPNVATPELFAKALFTDTSSWTVIDRGPMEALLPITSVLENMLDTFDPASPGKTKLEVRADTLDVFMSRELGWGGDTSCRHCRSGLRSFFFALLTVE